MISLGTHQSAIWGYSTADYPADSQISAVGGSYSYNGLFTKLTLAPNGNMYAILITSNVTLSSVVKECVIIKVTPGNSNTGNTNWQAASRSYLIPDGTAADSYGFARTAWPLNSGSAAIRFHTGILASNGLIYFAPYDTTDTTNKWVILNPATDTWKVTDTLRPSGTTTIANSTIGGIALGTDNKLYVAGTGTGRGFRITTSANAMSDTVEDSYYTQFVGTSSPLGSTAMTWTDSSGITYTDSAALLDSVTSVSAAYSPTTGSTSLRNFNRIRDMITHPSGKIFMVPGRGRGRIFYINETGWGTANELLSEPGYSTASITGYGVKSYGGYYAFLEKPRDLSHIASTLKLYIAPILGIQEQAYTNMSQDILVINPVTKSMSALNLGLANYAANSNSYASLNKRISMPNGMHVFVNTNATDAVSRQGGVMLTGWDVPSSDSDGSNTITMTNKGLMYRSDITSTNLNYIKTLIEQNPGFTAVGGGVNPNWPHNSKFLSFTGTPGSGTVFAQLTEYTSVKGYGPEITNFNFSARDQTYYQLPSVISTLGNSVYNSQFNKMK